MWEKMCDYCMDISKYFMTAVFVTILMGDLGDSHCLLYAISLVVGGTLLGLAWLFHAKGKKEKEEKRKKYTKFNNTKNRRT